MTTSSDSEELGEAIGDWPDKSPVSELHGLATQQQQRIAELEAQLKAKNTEISNLEDEVGEWQGSALLNGPYGDSEGITPTDNEQQVMLMRRQLASADRLYQAAIKQTLGTGVCPICDCWRASEGHHEDDCELLAYEQATRHSEHGEGGNNG